MKIVLGKVGRNLVGLLPYDAEVEYLESPANNTCRIDTGVPITRTRRIVITSQNTETANFRAWGTAGFENYLDENHYHTRVIRYNSVNTGQSYVYFDTINGKLTGSLPFVFSGIKDKHTYDLSFGIGRIDGNEFELLTTAFNPNQANPTPIRLFREQSRIWNCAIYEGDGSPLIDLIPVRFTNERGESEGAMYDKVSGQLFKNENRAESSFIIGPDKVKWRNPYITDGLIAMWDGEWNAGPGKHDASATVWKDLVGVRDMSLGASFSFEDDCANISSVKEVASFDPFVTSDIKTIEVVIEPLGINGVVFLAFAGSTTTTRWFGIRANSTFNFGQTATASNVASPLSRHYYAGTTEDTTSESAIPFDNYLDGSLVPSAGNGMSWGYSWKGRGAVNLVSTSFGGGRIYSIRIYNRALTADEIAANYEVDKERFNLA